MSLFARSYLLKLQKNIRLLNKSSICTKVEKTIDPTSGLCTKFEETIDPPIKQTNVIFFRRIFDLNSKKTIEILRKYPHLATSEHADIEKSVKTLKSFNYTTAEISQQAGLLTQSSSTIENRHEVLIEAGLQKVDLKLLAKYITIMNYRISLIKAYGYLPSDANVQQNLLQHFKGVNLRLPEPASDVVSLNQVRKVAINAYLTETLGAKSSDLAKIWKIYSRLKHRSIRTLTRNIALMTGTFQLTKELVLKNAFLLHADPDNVEMMLTKIPTIGGMPAIKFLKKRPKIIMANWQSVQTILDLIKEFNLPTNSLSSCQELLTLSPVTVRNRLLEMREVKEFQVLIDHPRMLRLILHHNKAQQRLKFLQQLKIKCASLHILSCTTEAFERFAREGADKTKGLDTTLFLAKTFQQDCADLRGELNRHPNWCNVPSSAVQDTLIYLMEQNFTKDEICSNVLLLFYPIKQIERKLEMLAAESALNEPGQTLTNSQKLALCLYYIELEFHFTGDGIWNEEPQQPDLAAPTFDFNVLRKQKFRYKTKMPDDDKFLSNSM